MYKNNYYAINWTDGMKINKHHFIETEQYIQHKIYEGIGLQISTYNYGLLPIQPQEHIKNLELEQTSDDLQLLQCKAVTLSGVLININKTMAHAAAKQLTLSFSNIKTGEATEWFVLVGVHLNKRLPLGEPNADEIPIRHPYTMPQYHLQVLPIQQTNAVELPTHHLIIGKLILKNGHFELLKPHQFLPPCHSLQSHAILKQKYKEWHTALGQIQHYAQIVINKLKENNTNSLKNNTLHISKTIAYHIASTFDDYKWLIPQKAPIHLFLYFVKLAQIGRAHV